MLQVLPPLLHFCICPLFDRPQKNWKSKTSTFSLESWLLLFPTTSHTPGSHLLLATWSSEHFLQGPRTLKWR
ncbi:hypothetical protein V8C40DRAFT_238570 [Trichoderma camerunense]